ncbi:MAG: PglZ domain-containing protein [Bacillota bacterium]
MFREWVLAKLAEVKDSPRVLVRDPLRLLPDPDGLIHNFAREHGFTVIVAATNLAFRDLYERAGTDPEVKKLLVIDRAPARRRSGASLPFSKAPPPFYPDLLAVTPAEARLDVDLRQFLKEVTGDPNWPLEVNDPRYARLIARHLEGVLRAHQNLCTARAGSFTDRDFKTIVAYAALGIPEAAFKKLAAEDYWKIGLLGHSVLEELSELTPEVTGPIREELARAPAPFCWLAEHNPETVIRSFYLSVILAQHAENWRLLLANLDPALAPFAGMKTEVLEEAAPRLVALDPAQAARDLEVVEQSLDRDALRFLLLDQWKLNEPSRFAAVLEKEGYSTLIRSLALLLALDDLLSGRPGRPEHGQLAGLFFATGKAAETRFVERRSSLAWSDLKEAYRLALEIQSLRKKLAGAVRTLQVRRGEQLSFDFFRHLWNEKKINRLEYYLSWLERLVESGNFLPRAAPELPPEFGEARERIRQRCRLITEDVHRQLDEVNRRFQELVVAQYPSWAAGDGEVYLTAQFIRRCLKPYWDPQKEKAVVLIFDGMRYDVWEEFLRPMLLDRLELLAEFPASSLLPSETHISRKAISAGAYPDEFDPHDGEDRLLKDALHRAFNYRGEVEVAAPEGAGTGETVRYRAGNLDVYIFELCDHALHGIRTKTLPDGREVPARPLAFIYRQHLKNIIDTEVMAVVRSLAPGTKVFVTADHGFARVGRQPLWFDEEDLNEKTDCNYLNCLLKTSFQQAGLPAKCKANMIAFTPEQLRLPAGETRVNQKTGQLTRKEYKAVVFPRTGFSFRRPGSPYNPDAYSHGGISLAEMLLPMAVLRVQAQAGGLLVLGSIRGPAEVPEGEEIEFRLRLSRAPQRIETDELRVEVEASYSGEEDRCFLPRQVLYVPAGGAEAVYRFRPDPAGAVEEERRKGVMERLFTVTVSYRVGHRLLRQAQTHRFCVRLNPEQLVRRVPVHLGNILGLTPKKMRS